jgi:LAO/AO transport system kinase
VPPRLLKHSVEELRAGILAGNRALLARALRVVEEFPEQGAALSTALQNHVGRARIIGFTGNPGAGKSTVVNAYITHLRQQGLKVAVLAIDPSSPFSGGALLGDRIRMNEHFADNHVYIRSMATRGQLGGLSRATFDATRVLDAAGFDVVVIETVGVGQDEIDIAQMAHTTVVVMVPGLGDDIQSIKAGLLEIADVFLINKSDLPGTPQLEKSLHTLLSLASPAPLWTPPIVKSTATEHKGIPQLHEAVQKHRDHMLTKEGAALSQKRSLHIFQQLLDQALVSHGRQLLHTHLPQSLAQLSAPNSDIRAVLDNLLFYLKN